MMVEPLLKVCRHVRQFLGEIPLDPPFVKGGCFPTRTFPLFFKEGLGEIFDCGNRERTKP